MNGGNRLKKKQKINLKFFLCKYFVHRINVNKLYKKNYNNRPPKTILALFYKRHKYATNKIILCKQVANRNFYLHSC